MQLIITEKPSVGRSICEALGIHDSGKHEGYIEGEDRIVSWCIGHLVEPAQPDRYDEALKKWAYDTLPIIPEHWEYEIKDGTKSQFAVLKKLMFLVPVDEIVCATDAGREGELIFRLVYEQAGCKKPVKRLWISSMEAESIRRGFDSLKDGADYENLYQSALCRQKADWLVGINGTRLFSVLYGKTLKVGRVQTPTLAMLVERDEEISHFQKKLFYTVHLKAGGMDAVSEKFDAKEEADALKNKCAGEQAKIIKLTKEEKTVSPPRLYDLTTLQRDANRLFGYTAKQTLEYTQSLYEKRLATYPRTDSQYLSDDMGATAGDVIREIFKSIMFEDAGSFQPDTGRILKGSKVTDHHAIIPTVEIGRTDLKSIPDMEMQVLSLIALRLVCATADRNIYQAVKAEIECGGHVFTATGKNTISDGWKAFERRFLHSNRIKEEDSEKEFQMTELTEEQLLDGFSLETAEGTTKPKPRFTEDSLLSAMERAGSGEMEEGVERKGLGTPATRADIIEKLVKDGLVRRDKRTLIPTDDGLRLITVLPDKLKSPALTAEWENELAMIAKGEASSEEFMDKITEMVRNLVSTYHEVGEEQKKAFAPSRESLGACPKCGRDVVKGKFGIYCSGRCNMAVGYAMGKQLTESQVKNLLNGKKILLKGLMNKSGRTYDACLTPDGIEEFTYEKAGEKKVMSQFRFKMEFPKKKEGRKTDG